MPRPIPLAALLCLASATLAFLVVNVGTARAGEAPLRVRAVEFTPTPAPLTEQERATAYTRSTLRLTLTDGSQRDYPLDYRILHRSGDTIGGGRAGQVVDAAGRPLRESARDARGNAARGPFFAAGADGTSLLALPGAGRELFLVNHIEYQPEGPNIEPARPPVSLYGLLPMAMNLTRLRQDAVSGRLTPVQLTNIDMAGVEGLWTPCNSSPTPWLSHLGSEEYEPDARVFEQMPLEAMNLYRGTPGRLAREGGANPYRYGHIVEVTVRADGATQVSKRYAMGRLSFELGDVMADRRTVYFGDDGEDVIRAMFVADRAGDLSSGTLYAARWHQEDGTGGSRARLEWIRLGHATETAIRALIDGGIAFSDLWETASAEVVQAEPARYAGFRPLYVYTGTGGKTRLEYYRLKPGREQAAAFLETRRYAAWRGATTEFTKMEGIAHSVAERMQWTVISTIRGGMLAGRNGERPRDDIRLDGDERDLACGAIYESRLRGSQVDSEGRAIDSELVAIDMRALISGQHAIPDPAAGRHDTCRTDRVANPDNIRYSEAMRTLFIGEDSGNHLNNSVWAYAIDSGALVRILSLPAGGEATGLGVYDDINGHAYITANVQHPGAAADLAHYPEAIRTTLRRQIDERGIVGYISGMPALSR